MCTLNQFRIRSSSQSRAARSLTPTATSATNGEIHTDRVPHLVRPPGSRRHCWFESLLFVFLKKLQEKRARRALILAFDSSFPFAVGERRLTHRSQPFSLWNYDYTRIPSIMEQRASTYQALFLRSLQLEGVFPDDQTVRVIPLRHTDAAWQPDLSDLPEVCRRDNPGLDSPTAVVEHIAEISTRFWLASACDRQLLQVAAAKVVAQRQAEIGAFLQGPAAGVVTR